jgi:hypothetical protein
MNSERKMHSILILIILLMLSPSTVNAQNDGGESFTYGDVQLTVPSAATQESMYLSPSRSNRGRTPGAVHGNTETDNEAASSEYFRNRLSGVVVSNSWDHNNWFYRASEIYTGIIPNIQDSLPHLSPYQSEIVRNDRPNSVVWIGFQPFGGFTRVFVQFARTPNFEIEELEDAHLLELSFPNSRLALSNLRRFLDTSYFQRSVEHIDAEQVSPNRSKLIIRREFIAPYQVSTDGDYLYIDFQDSGQF